MSETSSPTADAAYSLVDAGISRRERNDAVTFLELVDGVAYVEPASEDSALVYVGLTNGLPFNGDDTPNPLDSDTEAADYDPDGVRAVLLEMEHRMGVSCAPCRAYMHDEAVEYAVPLAHDDADFYGVPTERRGRITLPARPSTRERIDAYLRVVDASREITRNDVPELVEEVDEMIRHTIPSRAREAICKFFEFENAPYDDLRDAPEDVQAEYWRKMREISELHAEAADLIDDVDPDRAAEHRQTKLLDFDAYLQGVPSDWLDE